jgi:DNA (cytosine-5)-methyltransferase 1
VVKARHIPMIDLFAGPGGLGEGFSALKTKEGRFPFHIGLSIEKDFRAQMTLQLRSFWRQFGDASVPNDYYEALQDTERPLEHRLRDLYDSYPREAARATSEAWMAELGKHDHREVFDRIDHVLSNHETWVLLGGPPCQAYSLAGRSRNKGITDYEAHKDERQYLYIEYLQVIAEHRPAIFVMENVKGLLSATIKKRRIFDQIQDDLVNPRAALSREGRKIRTPRLRRPLPRYRLFSLVRPSTLDSGSFGDYVVEMERYGIPQSRHRLILVGVRTDLLNSSIPEFLIPQDPIASRSVLDGLPRLRSGLSQEEDSCVSWLARVREAKTRRWFSAHARRLDTAITKDLMNAVKSLRAPQKKRGGEFVEYNATIAYKPGWFLDKRLGGVLNHSTRGHLVKDLHRYLYCACYGKSQGRSPVLSDFPRDLLPDHRNVRGALNDLAFADRFRVQLADRPSTTITSHISKDGHYYIHYDSSQCRSLTVREAARLQTFPDNYFFCGPRTSQYGQVGNAVPPLLARQIATVVHKFLKDCGASA